jgi:hypothetical protein
MSTTGMLWFAMLDAERNKILLLFLLRLRLMTGLPALLISTNIAPGHMFAVSSAADIYQGYTLGVQSVENPTSVFCMVRNLACRDRIRVAAG